MKSIPQLTPWQKKQAALLYYFSSDEYLRGLQTRVHELQILVDELLNQSRLEGRDQFIRNSHWEERDTSETWSNHAWPFLEDFGLSVARHLADRSSEIYHVTDSYQCGRGISEFSMDWTTPDEQERFDAALNSVSKYAAYIDKTMNKSLHVSRWTDFGFSLAWEKHAAQFPHLPKFKIRHDIQCNTGEIPSKTGVYISSEYPDASLQFAWKGDKYGKLLDCSMFNNLGRQALIAVGRPKLWVDGNSMLEFLKRNGESEVLKQNPFYEDSFDPDLAPSLIAEHSFTSAPSGWWFVELLDEEYEPVESETNISDLTQRRRIDAGETCEISGFYFSPASVNSRQLFKKGDVFPVLNITYGNTIWQSDEKQD